jgi:hypothetical protein
MLVDIWLSPVGWSSPHLSRTGLPIKSLEPMLNLPSAVLNGRQRIITKLVRSPEGESERSSQNHVSSQLGKPTATQHYAGFFTPTFRRSKWSLKSYSKTNMVD